MLRICLAKWNNNKVNEALFASQILCFSQRALSYKILIEGLRPSYTEFYNLTGPEINTSVMIKGYHYNLL